MNAKDILENVLGPENMKIIYSLIRKLTEKWGNLEEAKKWREKAEESAE